MRSGFIYLIILLLPFVMFFTQGGGLLVLYFCLSILLFVVYILLLLGEFNIMNREYGSISGCKRDYLLGLSFIFFRKKKIYFEGRKIFCIYRSDYLFLYEDLFWRNVFIQDKI